MTIATRPLSVSDLAARFRKGNRWAAARMREMRHTKTGGDLFTTEEWLAEWLAAESVPQRNWPPQNLDPLEDAVLSRAIQLIGELAKAGKIQVISDDPVTVLVAATQHKQSEER